MTHIICLSNLSVPAVLTITKGLEKFRIITDQPSLNNFFTEIYGPGKTVLIPPIPKFRGIKKIFKPILLNRFRKEIMNLAGMPENNEIFFFYNAMGYPMSWWISKVAHLNRVFYKPDIDMSMFKAKMTMKSFIKQTWIRINYGIHTTPSWTGERFIYKVSDQFLEKYDIARITDFTVDHEHIHRLVKDKLNLDKKKFLFLTGNTVPDRMVEEEEFIRVTDNFIDTVGKENIAVKVHPRFTTLISKEKICQLVPTYLPANVLLPNYQYVIGYTSSVLFEAANIGIPGISMLDMYKPINPARREEYRKYLNQNLKPGSAPIYFPKDMDELMKLTGSAEAKKIVETAY